MRRWIAAGLLLLVLIAAGVGFLVLNLNRYLADNKAWLTEQAQAILGRPVRFAEVRVSLLGGLGARVTDLSIGEDPAFAAAPFVQADQVYVLVKFLPALLGRYELSRIELDRPAITVIRTAAGFNFETVGRSPGEDSSAQRAGEDRPPPAAGGPAPMAAAMGALSIEKVAIEGGSVRYLDRTATPPAEYAVERLDLSASNIGSSAPIRVQLAAALLAAEGQDLSLSGTVGPLAPAPSPAAIPLDLAVGIRILALQDLRRLPAVAGALPADLSVSPPLRVEARLKGTPESLRLSASVDATGAAIAYGGLVDKPAGTELHLSFDARRDGSSILVEQLVLRLAGLQLAASGTIGTDPPLLNLSVDSEKAPLAELGRLLPPLADHPVAGLLTAHLRAQGRIGSAVLPRLDGTLAVENLAAGGKGGLPEISCPRLAISLRGHAAEVSETTFQVAGLPVRLRATIENFRAPTAAFSLSAAELRPVAFGDAAADDVLRRLEISGTLSSGGDNGRALRAEIRSASGRLHAIPYENLAADASLQGDALSLQRISFNAFGGRYRGSGSYDLAQNNRFRAQSTVNAVNLQPLLDSQDVAAARHLRGRLDAELTMTGEGDEWAGIRDALAGSGRIAVVDGGLVNVNIAETVLSGVTGIGGLTQLISPRVRAKYPSIFHSADTAFEELAGTVRIAGGRATTDDLRLRTPDYSITGAGSLIFDDQLDFRATLFASEELTRDIIASVKEARYLTDRRGLLEIPFRITGTLAHVKARPERDFIAKALQRALLGEGIDKLLGRKRRQGSDRKAVEELIQKGIEGLFD